MKSILNKWDQLMYVTDEKFIAFCRAQHDTNNFPVVRIIIVVYH